MDWDKYGFVVGSKLRLEILKSLKYAKTPTQISKETGNKASNISSTLADFTKQGIAECLTPKKRVGKIFKLTKLGEEILNYYKDSTKKQDES